ncbi:MAG: peptidase, partial [Polaromonas sp.]|nr:peptidase [Polaromonas sp.]
MTTPSTAFTTQDLFLHQKLTELHCAPGVDLAAATVRSVDQASDAYVSCIWAFSADSPPRQLTRGPGLDKSPRWSPQGDQLAFLSNRAGGVHQLYLMPLDGGEARQVGPLDQSVSSLRWMPDGASLLVTASVSVNPDNRGKRTGPAAPQQGAN